MLSKIMFLMLTCGVYGIKSDPLNHRTINQSGNSPICWLILKPSPPLPEQGSSNSRSLHLQDPGTFCEIERIRRACNPEPVGVCMILEELPSTDARQGGNEIFDCVDLILFTNRRDRFDVVNVVCFPPIRHRDPLVRIFCVAKPVTPDAFPAVVLHRPQD